MSTSPHWVKCDNLLVTEVLTRLFSGKETGTIPYPPLLGVLCLHIPATAMADAAYSSLVIPPTSYYFYSDFSQSRTFVLLYSPAVLTIKIPGPIVTPPAGISVTYGSQDNTRQDEQYQSPPERHQGHDDWSSNWNILHNMNNKYRCYLYTGKAIWIFDMICSS